MTLSNAFTSSIQWIFAFFHITLHLDAFLRKEEPLIDFAKPADYPPSAFEMAKQFLRELLETLCECHHRSFCVCSNLIVLYRKYSSSNIKDDEARQVAEAIIRPAELDLEEVVTVELS